MIRHDLHPLFFELRLVHRKQFVEDKQVCRQTRLFFTRNCFLVRRGVRARKFKR